MERNHLFFTPEDFLLTEKHVVVTGGGRVLVQALALSVLNAGANVTVIAQSADQLAETTRLNETMLINSFEHAPVFLILIPSMEL